MFLYLKPPKPPDLGSPDLFQGHCSSPTASPFFLLLGEMLLVGEMQAEEK